MSLAERINDDIKKAMLARDTRKLEALRAIARRWGSQAGMPAAEVFSLVRELKTW